VLCFALPASRNVKVALRSPQLSPASSLPVSCWAQRFANSLRLKVSQPRGWPRALDIGPSLSLKLPNDIIVSSFGLHDPREQETGLSAIKSGAVCEEFLRGCDGTLSSA
jgi:hypothetical protein